MQHHASCPRAQTNSTSTTRSADFTSTILLAPTCTMAESKDTPSRRVSSRIAGKPDNGLPSATAAAAKRKPTDAPAPAKKAKVVGAAAPTGNAAPSPASKVLTKGSPLPAVTLRDESGKDIDIAQLKKTVIFT